MEENENNDVSVAKTVAPSPTAAASAVEQQTPDVKNDDALAKLHKLEQENRKMQTEFNLQRAKLKELFMQKETEYGKCQAEKQMLQRELEELKSQFLVADMKSENELELKEIKAQEEILSLQQLVQDTIDESTICKAELERIKEEYQRLWLANKEMHDGLQHQQQQQQQQYQQESTSLGPQVLSQVKKTIVRKLGGDSAASASGHQDSFDETAKKGGNKYAQEDTELLRSIVEQLQEEMKALKEKLREADEKIQTNSGNNSSLVLIQESPLNQSNPLDEKSINKSTSMDVALECGTCQSYETKVQHLLKQQTEDQQKVEELEKCVKEAQEDLNKEAALRKDLEDQWQEKREAHKKEVQLLREQVKCNEKELLELQQKFLETKEQVMKELQRLTDDRELVNKQLETLQADNEFLSGQYLATAEQIESQNINLPNTVDELQELMLRQRNELIQARVSSQYEQQKCVSSLDEIKILQDQLMSSNEERRMYKKKMQTEIKSLEDRLKEHLLTQQNYETTKTTLERKESELNRQISEFRVQNIELQENNEKLNKINAEYKAKILNLQVDLSTSEQVQKDFVKLSQTLQMSLEKLRRSDAEVRWQDDDDVDNCPTCSAFFTVTVRKLHCRHCGNIYCEKCLSKSVPSGPRKRPARVCDICHTLLTPNTAPYFSHEPLQSS